ncbi:MAG: MarR family winged helix-turn-helix transcriptional regulator [Gammaproteobacteria bacterium]|nr:MarR family winged helix-turn-helix transcriptional regulator [Gammaproteobacteria bacterium]
MASSGRRDLRLNSFLPYVLSNLAERVSDGLSHIYADEYQLTIPEWRVIANLAEHDTLNARQIVEFTTMEKSKVSRAVTNLCARGLVSQQRARGDSRAKDLSLTGSGRALYRGIAPKVLAWERELLDELSPGEYRDLMYVLEKLGNRLKSMR